jgi:phage gp36-like protein
MAYIAQGDFAGRLKEQELIELTDDHKVGEVDAAVLAQVLAEASGRLDSYAGGHYALPLEASEQVKSLALDIAIYLLYRRRPGRRVPDEVKNAHDEAMHILRDVAAGRAQLSQPAKQQSNEMKTLRGEHAAEGVFGDDKTEAF